MKLGPWAEHLAAQELKRRGYAILATNFRQRLGEIDIVAQHEGWTVFIEVKARATVRYGPPFAAVTARKQLRLRRAAHVWMITHPTSGDQYRFDVVSIVMNPGGTLENLEVIPYAF